MGFLLSVVGYGGAIGTIAGKEINAQNVN